MLFHGLREVPKELDRREPDTFNHNTVSNTLYAPSTVSSASAPIALETLVMIFPFAEDDHLELRVRILRATYLG